MKLLSTFAFFFLSAVLMMAQTNDGASVADDLKALRNALAEQQKQIADQQKKIEKLQHALDSRQLPDTNAGSPQLVDASLHKYNNATTPVAASDTAAQDKPKESPLSFRIGGAEFTPGGYVDFENIFRSTNTGNVAGTNFWAIPFSNTTPGHLTEFRSTGQYSRFNLKTTTKFGENDITGFIEFDFNGNDAANVFVTSNPHTDRLRLFWLDLKRGKWEFAAGQMWGLLTANRIGVSPNSADVFTTFNEDANHQIGNNFTRAGQFRAAYHFNNKFVWAAGIENAQQFSGQGAEVVFPAVFGATSVSNVPGQFDAANNAGVPNVGPDIVSKLAYDNDIAGGRHVHLEAGGLFTAVKVANVPTVAGATFTTHSQIGGGISGGLSLDLIKSNGKYLRVVSNGLWGPGVGRYLLGTGPQAVIVPVSANGAACSSTGGCDLRVSMVHAGNALVGLEMLPHPKTLIGAYYGGAYFQRNAFPDITAAGAVKPIIGFGGTGEANNLVQNRAIQEGTLDITETFWRNPQYGALQLVMQGSYVTRSPWFVAAGAPKNAHLTMGYVSLKYILP